MTRVRRFGVDEAGKGPVFGPMVVAAAVADVATLPTGIQDSKQLSASKRRSLAQTLHAHDDVDIVIAKVPPAQIDADDWDMNELTVAAFADTIDAVATPRMAGMADASDTDADRFARRVARRIETDVALTAEHGADESDPVVGAASIVAKVERDAHIAALAEEYGDIGSGYPSDPTTREFLADYIDQHGEVPPFARQSWSTCRDLLDAAST